MSNNHNRDAVKDKQNLYEKKEKFANAINACSKKGRAKQQGIMKSVEKIKEDLKKVAETARLPKAINRYR